jgi:hypothetical protein
MYGIVTLSVEIAVFSTVGVTGQPFRSAGDSAGQPRRLWRAAYRSHHSPVPVQLVGDNLGLVRVPASARRISFKKLDELL